MKNKGGVSTKVFSPEDSMASFTPKSKEVQSNKRSSLNFQIVLGAPMVSERREVKLALFSEEGESLPFSARIQAIKPLLEICGPKVLICGKTLEIGDTGSVPLEVKNAGRETLFLYKFAHVLSKETMEMKYTKWKESDIDHSQGIQVPVTERNVKVDLQFTASEVGWHMQHVEISSDVECSSGTHVSGTQQVTLVSYVGPTTKPAILEASESKPCRTNDLLRMGTIPLEHLCMLKSYDHDSWIAALLHAILPYDLCNGAKISSHRSKALEEAKSNNKDIIFNRFMGDFRMHQVSRHVSSTMEKFLDEDIPRLQTQPSLQGIRLPNNIVSQDFQKVHRALVVAGTPGNDDMTWRVACACLGGCMAKAKSAHNFMIVSSQFGATLWEASEPQSINKAFAICRDFSGDADMRQMDALESCIEILSSDECSLAALLSCLWDHKTPTGVPTLVSDIMAATCDTERTWDTQETLAQKLVSANVRPVITKLFLQNPCEVLQGILDILQIKCTEDGVNSGALRKIVATQKLLQKNQNGLLDLMKCFEFKTAKTSQLKQRMNSRDTQYWLRTSALEALGEVFSRHFKWRLLGFSESGKWARVEKAVKSIMSPKKRGDWGYTGDELWLDDADIKSLIHAIGSGSPVR